MKCSKTGRRVVFGQAHVYAGDEFECPTCKTRVVICSAPYHDPDVREHEEDPIIMGAV